MGLPAEFVATRIGMTWPRQESCFLASALNSILDSILTCAPNGISGHMSLNIRVIRVAPVFSRHVLGWC